MVRRKWMLALFFFAISDSHSQDAVFVDLERLATLHPAWQLVDFINRKPKPSVLTWSPRILPLPDLTMPAPTLQGGQLADWFEEQKRKWTNELELLQRKQKQILAWQMHLLLPPLPLTDPVARWKFRVQQGERQAAERVRLNLRLSFADMLSPEEKAALEQRKRELDAELESPPIISQPILIPISPAQGFELTPPLPLTDPQRILDLTSPSLFPSRQTLQVQISDIDDSSLRPLSGNAVTTLRSIAFEAAKSFAVAYAKRRGWKVTFSPHSKLPDATNEVKRAWQQWLKSFQVKE
ncbi:MAG: hypothetical protein N2116_00105 [Armatimonadetes bacterium]|nr:hypothetical protein [Armatimonadota bacterium]